MINGNIVFYENIGTEDSFEFIWITDNFGMINVNEYASPSFIDLDSDNDYDLLVGSGQDGILIYENVGNAVIHDYIISDAINCDIKGKQLSPTSFSFLNPYSIDILVGLGTGGLYHSKLNICHHGDVNLDSNINVLDINEIISFLLYQSTYLSDVICSGDLNEDEGVDILDILIIINIILE